MRTKFMDRISNLPVSLKEKIIFSLLRKDAIRMSFSSKQWKSLWNSTWNSLPVIAFHFHLGEEDATSIDNLLQRRLLEHKHQKCIIEFSLSVGWNRKIEDSDIDHWIKMINKYYVTKLSLYITPSKHRYKFLAFGFDVGSLTELKLHHVDLNKNLLIQDGTIFCSLKVIQLQDVYFNEIGVAELLSRCPLLETFQLYLCQNLRYLGHHEVLQNLELYHSFLPKVKNVGIQTEYPINFKIEAPNLECLLYNDHSGSYKPLDLDEVCCRNLKKLNVKCQEGTIGNLYIKEVIRKFPLLEDLNIHAFTFGGACENHIKISSQKLKSLTISEDANRKKIIIDAPNLVAYTYEGKGSLPPSFSLNSVKLERHIVYLWNPYLNRTTWFCELRQYLGQLPPHAVQMLELTIHGHNGENGRIFSRRFENLSPPQKVLRLHLKDIEPILDGDFVNAILSSCHPTCISVRSCLGLIGVQRKVLYENLIDREENPRCCGNIRNKCWRHYLKSANVKSFVRDGNNMHIDECGENSSISFTDVKEANQVNFELQWFDEEVVARS